jgi:hypothetical protein
VADDPSVLVEVDVLAEVDDAVVPLADREVVPRDLGQGAVGGLPLFDAPALDAADRLRLVAHDDPEDDALAVHVAGQDQPVARLEDEVLVAADRGEAAAPVEPEVGRGRRSRRQSALAAQSQAHPERQRGHQDHDADEPHYARPHDPHHPSSTRPATF